MQDGVGHSNDHVLPLDPGFPVDDEAIAVVFGGGPHYRNRWSLLTIGPRGVPRLHPQLDETISGRYFEIMVGHMGPTVDYGGKEVASTPLYDLFGQVGHLHVHTHKLNLVNELDPLTGLDLDDPNAYGAAFAEVYDRWYDGVTDAEATARFVDQVSPPGPVLELGVGTGRLAQPLSARGRIVFGVDSSAAMLAHCPPSDALRVRADMRALPFRPGRFASVLIAFNTLFNVATVEGQRQTLADAAQATTPTGVVIVEAIDGTLLGHSPTASVGVSRRSEDGVVVSATEVDPTNQTITGRHLDIDDGGVTVRPWRLRWLEPGELDELARDVGLDLVTRRSGWSDSDGNGGPQPATPSLVSVYRATN